MRRIGILAGVIFTAAFFVLAVRFGTEAQTYADSVVVLLDGEPLDGEQAAMLCGQEPESGEQAGFCFWGEENKTELFCRETGGAGVVNTILVQGNPELIVSGIGTLAYQEHGCFLDAQTSTQLFGTQQAKGQTVWCGDQPYTVCGTVESMDRIMIRQASEADGAVLDMLSLYLTENSGGSSGSAQQFLIRYGLSGKVMDTQFLSAAAQNMLLLLPLILGIWLIRLLAVQAADADGLWYRAAYAAGALFACAAVLYFVIRRIEIPPDMIPTKWSDFSFWEQWWENQRENLLLIFRTAKGEAQLTMLWNMSLSMICSVCAAFSGLLLILGIGTDSKNKNRLYSKENLSIL